MDTHTHTHTQTRAWTHTPTDARTHRHTINYGVEASTGDKLRITILPKCHTLAAGGDSQQNSSGFPFLLEEHKRGTADTVVAGRVSEDSVVATAAGLSVFRTKMMKPIK